jgi:hypothetical protein
MSNTGPLKVTVPEDESTPAASAGVVMMIGAVLVRERKKTQGTAVFVP